MCQELPLMQKKLYDLLSVMNLGFKARITITTELNDYKKITAFLIWLRGRLLKDKKEPSEEEILLKVGMISKTPFLF